MINRAHQVANPERTSIELSDKVKEIDAALASDPDNGELWMQRGLALSEMRLFREAVEAYSKAISLDPFQGIFYRHRAHRHLSCWEYPEALADFVVASRLIPDNWDVWYHLGLSHYLLGEYDKAEKAYRVCYQLSDADDRRIPVTNWYWAALMRQGKTDQAAALLEPIHEQMDCGPDGRSYYNMLLLYKGLMTAEEIEAEHKEAYHNITQLYGVANYFYLNGDVENSNRVIERILQEGDGEWWSAFGYLAAKVDKQNRRMANAV